ncbi:MAG: hypothetical protein WCE23_03365 [Candidatus Binatus sp.]
MIRTLDQADAARVVEVLGGERIYVPAAADPAFSRLAARLGEEIARKVCAAFGGGRVTFPQRLVPLDEEIGRLRREMLTPTEIARHLHCAERYVYLVLARE